MRVLVLVAVAITALLGATVGAQESRPDERRTLDIAASQLGSALNELARQHGFQIVYVAEDVVGIRSHEVKGRYTAAEALGVLLDGTGFGFRSLGDHTFTLVPPAAARPSQPATGLLEEPPRSPAAGDTAPGVVEEAGQNVELIEVIVTAERRSVELQKVAQSISVRTGEQLANEGKYSIAQVLEDVSGVSHVSPTGNSGTDLVGSSVTIRGIASNQGAGGSPSSVAPATAVYVDGVYEGIGGSYDLDRIEILRGPHGTLYGRSATAGVIAMHTAKPDLGRFGGQFSPEFGSFSLKRFTGAFNAPLIEDLLGARISINRYERDGYLSAEGGRIETSGGRFKLLYQPNQDLSLLVAAAFQENRSKVGGVTSYLATPDSYYYQSTPIGSRQDEFRQYWAELNWDLGPVILTYQPAFRQWQSDSTFYIRGILNFDTGASTPKDNFLTHELRLASTPGGPFTWQAGALYYRNTLRNIATSRTNPISEPGGFDSETRAKDTFALGVFGDATLPLTATTRLNGGLRYDLTELEATQSYTAYSFFPIGSTQVLGGDAGSREYRNTTFKVRLEHDLTPRSLLYASVSSGFSPGDVTVTAGANNEPVILDLNAETLIAYEIGSKNRFDGNRLQVNGAAYYYDYGGFQTANVNLTPLGVPTSATLKSKAIILGAEVEVSWRASPADLVNLSVAYTNARWASKSDALLTVGNGLAVTFDNYFDRDEIPSVAPLTSNLSYQRILNLDADSEIRLQAEARFTSAYYGSNLYSSRIVGEELAAENAEFARVGAQMVGNVSATWAYRNYTLTGYVRNVSDSDYKTSLAFMNGGQWLATPYDPRTYGLVFDARW